MSDEQKAPVAIRITRPYTTEEEFLEREFDTLTRTSVILLGAQARPQGVVLRFEIVLKGGESVLRGEGRVVAHKDKAHGGEQGLTLRFTRLDSRSKALVDRASAFREARAKGTISAMAMSAVAVPIPPAASSSNPAVPETMPPPSSTSSPGREMSRRTGPPPLPTQAPAPPPSRRGPPPLPPSVPGPVSAVPSSFGLEEIESTQVDLSFHRHEAAPAPAPAATRSVPPVPVAPTPNRTTSSRPPPPRPSSKPRTPIPPLPARARSQPPPPLPLPAPPERSAGPSPRTVARPAEREALLHRLRTRGRSLPASRVGEILAKRAAR